MALTPKQESFALKVGAEGLGLTEAYKLTYDCTKSLPETIHGRASELARSPAVAARIARIQGDRVAAAVQKASYTLADAIREAEEIRLLAVAAGNLPAAATASTLKSKLAGHLVDRREIKSGPLEESDVTELEELRAELLKRRAAQTGEAIDFDEGNRPQLRPN